MMRLQDHHLEKDIGVRMTPLFVETVQREMGLQSMKTGCPEREDQVDAKDKNKRAGWMGVAI
jgi:hypothetical protein